MADFPLLRVIAALVLVVGLIAVCAWLAKRSGLAGAMGSGVSMRLLSRMSLGARSSIVVVNVQGENLVLGITPGGIHMLHRLPDHSVPEVASSPGNGDGAQEPRPSFARILGKIWQPERTQSS